MKRFIYVHDPFIEEMLERYPNRMFEYSYKHFVQAFDTIEKMGFTPQDWNFAWEPTEDFELVSQELFTEIVSKEMKSMTTHFNQQRYFRRD